MTVLSNLQDKPFMLGFCLDKVDRLESWTHRQTTHRASCITLRHNWYVNHQCSNTVARYDARNNFWPCYFCWPTIFLHFGLLFLTLTHFWFWNQFHKCLPPPALPVYGASPRHSHQISLRSPWTAVPGWHGCCGHRLSHRSRQHLVNYIPVIWANSVKWYHVTGLTVRPGDFSCCLSCSASAVSGDGTVRSLPGPSCDRPPPALPAPPARWAPASLTDRAVGRGMGSQGVQI